MTDAAWLGLALAAGALFAAGWITRELWIHRRRRRNAALQPPDRSRT